MVCGSALRYLEQGEGVTCSSCGVAEQGHIACPQGHYVCEACHNRDTLQGIREIALTTRSLDPFEIVAAMLGLEGLPMLGCQHAYIAGGAFMAAVRNAGARTIGETEMLEVFNRTAQQAHGGFCGLSGVCGIAPALGACFAALTGSTCGTDRPQRITMEAVSRITRAITDLTGPSCCKAYIWTSLAAAAAYLQESLGITLPLSGAPACVFSDHHPHGCRTTNCPYYQTAGVNGSSVSAPCRTEAAAPPQSQKGEKVMHDNKALDLLLRRARELGADDARVIDTASVAVEEWVRWKCLYGCALLGKDTCHPPSAPDAESTRKVMKEYRRAILLTSSRGKALSETAVRLEGEAYHQGYYKAFALTALSSGPEGAT